MTTAQSRRRWGVGLAVALLLAMLAALVTPAEAQYRRQAATTPAATLDAYTVTLTSDRAGAISRDTHDITRIEAGPDGAAVLEVIMTAAEAAALTAQGLDVQRNPEGDGTGGASAFSQATGVFRPYAGPGNLQEEIIALAAAHPDIADLEVIGQSVQGQDILAVQVTRNAGQGRDGQKPTVLYVATQHAREWITPEVTMRLLRLFLEGYGTDPALTDLVDTRELWFVPVANPDGYDHTFTDGNRLWRKNLADNNASGTIEVGDGVDLNRNWPHRWGYDDEGSSPNPASDVYRGPAPASEPETVALDQLVQRLSPEFMVNYHSAAELILYGVGSQVATPTPDDVILATLAGDDEQPAIPGFDPDLSAELYTTNGETTEHVGYTYGVLAYTPELSTCQTVAPDPSSCQSVFNFPDDEALIQAEFERNIPFALDVARSAADPFEPVSHLGNTAPDYVLDAFDVAHSGTTEVAAVVSRQIRNPQLRYAINGGRTRIAQTQEWAGGERYGEGHDRYYREVRGTVTGARPGDTVEVWFRGGAGGSGNAESDRFTYTVATEAADVLVIANEDYDGVAPEQPGVTAPRYAGYYTDALAAAGYSADVWDLDAQGIPHHLGVLAHHDAVIWYTGDNRITSEPEDLGILGLPDLGVDESMQYLTVAVRDHLNEGGKLVQTGEYAGYFGPFVSQTGGLFYGDNGAPDEPCTVEGNLFDDCLIWSDDFHQYWLGSYARQAVADPSVVEGIAPPLEGLTVTLGGGDSADNQEAAGSTIVTSDVLPVEEFPQFASQASAIYTTSGDGPFDPRTGEWYAGVLATDLAYNRLTRTIDLTGVSGADVPTLSFWTSYDVEEAYDFFAVEARTAGADDWTTLPDDNGGTVQGPLFVCEDGLWDVHPFVFDHYVDEATCAPTGPTGGALHAFNGSSGGYVQAAFDLSAYAGGVVEVSLAYISDIGVTNVGAFVDDVALTVGGVVVEEEGFEDGLGAWAPTPPPAGSPAASTDWSRSTGLLPEPAAAVSTEDSVFLPFGFEGVTDQTQRNALMAALMGGLIGG